MSSIAKRIISVVGLTVALGGAAQAQHGCHYGGHYGESHHGGIHQSGGHAVLPYVPTYRVQPAYTNYTSPSFGHRYHDTTHLDYHAPSWVPHNGHYDYQSGHYDVHRTGHWH